MSTIFYDKDAIETDKVAKNLCQHLDTIQAGYSNDVGSLRKAFAVYHDYDVELQARAAKLLTNASKWTPLGTLAGTAVGALVAWEVLRGAIVLLRWIGDKMSQQDKEPDFRAYRIHAREWYNN